MFNLTKLALLWDWVSDLKKKVGPTGENLLPSRSTATSGQILKLTRETKIPVWADEYSYTPPAYSETEVNTGQKWIDGKDIFRKTIVGTTSAESGNETIGSVTFDTIIDFKMVFLRNDGFYLYTAPSVLIQATNGNVIIAKSTTATYMETGYIVNVYYTKPDPVPGNAKGPETEEPEEKKTTKKKTTK